MARLPIAFLCLLFYLTAAGQSPPTPLEYRVKAGYLYNFTKYVTWPPDADSPQNAPIIIGVLGEDPFGDALDQTLAGKVVNGHPLVIRRSTRASALLDAQIIFISNSEQRHLDRFLKLFDNRPILTVSDISQFAVHGGMVEFVIANHVVRFQINRGVASQAGLKIDARMLNAAIMVYSQRTEP